MAYVMWWLQEGCNEFPEVAPIAPVDDYADLFLPVEQAPSPLGLALWRLRPDLQATIPLDAVMADERLQAWLFLHGLTDHGLLPLVGGKIRDWLNESAGTAGVTRLVRMVALLDEGAAGLDGQALFDWFVVSGRFDAKVVCLLTEGAYLTIARHLFAKAHGVSGHDQSDLLAHVLWWLDEGKSHLPDFVPLEPVDCYAPLLLPNVEHVSQLASALWQRRPDLQASFPQENAGGRVRLQAWLFLHGLSEYKLSALLGSAVRGWLLSAGAAGVGHLAEMIWHWREDLQVAFDLNHATGPGGLERWFLQYAAGEFPLVAALGNAGENVPSRPARIAQVLPPREHGVNLIGWACGELGIGEDLRCMALALRSAQVPYTIVNLPNDGGRYADETVKADISNSRLYDTNVFCLPGMDTMRAFVRLGPEFFAGVWNIGNWPWELPVWPQSWEFALDFVDELWGISRFCRDCYASATTKPVQWMLPAVRPVEADRPERQALGLPSGPLLFTSIFDFRSYIDRKNPMATLEAFELAFGARGEAVLVVKVMNTDQDSPRWQAFRARAAANPCVRLIEATWSYERTMGLVAISDCFVSLHRSEGFGRCIAEAMILGVPVVATGWSGSTDLTAHGRALEVDYRLVPVPDGAYPHATGLCWAEPSVVHAASRMRQVAAEADAMRDMAQRTRDHVLAEHSIVSAGRRYRQRLEQLWKK